MKSLFKYLFVSLIMLFSFTGCSLKEVANSINQSIVKDVAKVIKDRTPINNDQGVTITYNPAHPKQSTHEDQEYVVEVTVRKGDQVSKTSFTERVPHDPTLKQQYIDNSNQQIAQSIANNINARGATHKDVTITYEPNQPKTATSKDQTYDVEVTVTKAGQSAKYHFVETVLCDPKLRDEEDLQYIKEIASKISSRNNDQIDGVTFRYDPAKPKEATKDTQTYDVKVTISKGTQSLTTSFKETVSFNKSLRFNHTISEEKHNLEAILKNQQISLEQREKFKQYIQNMIVVVLEERELKTQERKEMISKLMSMRDMLIEQREQEIKKVLEANKVVIDTLREDLKQRDIALDKREDLNLQIAKLIEQILNDRSKSVEQRNSDIKKLLQLRDALVEQRSLMMSQSNK